MTTIELRIKGLEEEIKRLRNMLRATDAKAQLAQDQARTPPARAPIGSGLGYAIVNTGGVSACSGTTPGTGSVSLWTNNNGAMEDSGKDIDVISWFTSASVASGKHAIIFSDGYNYSLLSADC